MQELRLSVTIPLPDDIFARAEVLSSVKPTLDSFMTALSMIEGTTHEIDVVTPKPRSAKEPASMPLLDTAKPDLAMSDPDLDVAVG